MSTNSGGAGGAAGSSGSPSISGDGSVVCFTSDAADIAPTDTNAQLDVFARRWK